MNRWDQFTGVNAGYVYELYERYQRDPGSVDDSTRAFFSNWSPEIEAAPRPEDGAVRPADLTAAIAAFNLAESIRRFGHLAARLDPLGIAEPVGDPSLQPQSHGLTADTLARLPASIVSGDAAEGAANALDAIERLRRIYCATTGHDYNHVFVPAERVWLRHAVESGQFRPPKDPVNAPELLDRITRVETFERFLHRTFPGKTRFSIEGLDLMIPVLDEIIHDAAAGGVAHVMIAMAHRGRLNVLAHVLQKPYTQVLAEFKDPLFARSGRIDLGWMGDVKYHAGARYLADRDGKSQSLIISMPPNPSHLEAVDPVLAGMARAAATTVDRPGPPALSPGKVLGILIHGDAAFPGQGVVAETLNLSRLDGYAVGGIIHVIANNQLGFTAGPRESYSTSYASGLARGFKIPITHVNADDSVACIEAARLAWAYRQQFGLDFLIDLVGYRRYGHNEGDEPAFTQPEIYQIVGGHPTVRDIYTRALISDGVITQDQSDAMVKHHMTTLEQAYAALNPEEDYEPPLPSVPPSGAAGRVHTGVPVNRLAALNRNLMQVPEGFVVHRKLERARERRLAMLDQPHERTIDWATAEDLAFASILEDGVAIRLTGEDVERGTFSQRHSVLHDAVSGERFTPLAALAQARAAFEVHNSPLSENAAVGFELGYNIQEPRRLVVWEAQYGDFINGAQVVLDEFMTSGRAKWGLTPSLVLLLPHGYEGQGPDHSSARLERFLQSAADTNMRIANCTSAANYFHLLRRQALLLDTDPLPLVALTPKSLLRHPLTASAARELAEGRFRLVIDDEDARRQAAKIKRLVLCSGKIFVDLISSEQRKAGAEVAIVRVEQLYPFPADQIREILDGYPALGDVCWVQEEPENMGAWEFARPLVEQLIDGRCPLRYIGRVRNSSPSEGSAAWHAINQRAIVDQVFENRAAPKEADRVLSKQVRVLGFQAPMPNIIVPQLGESVVEARVAKWLKKPGDQVAMGDPLVELETEKVDLEVSADRPGVLVSIAHDEGADVKVGEVLGVLEPREAGAKTDDAKVASQPAVKAPPAPEIKATPTARNVARDAGVSLDSVAATGAAGRVTKSDVLRAKAPGAPVAPAAPTAPVAPIAPVSRERRERMSKRRATIARRLVEAQHNAAMLTTFNEVDMSAVMGLRERRKEAFQKQHGVNLGIASFFVKATIGALSAFPQLNAEIQGDEIVFKSYFDIGMAVGAEGGLVVPVIRDANTRSFGEIEHAIRDFAKRAQDGTLTLDDLKGGTFTITNGGVFGSLMSTPILNPPQVGILGLHKIADRPVAIGGEVVIRPMMYLALSYDHRIVDGREAVQFLVKIKEYVEDPGWMLIG